jgi:hypothetical protein
MQWNPTAAVAAWLLPGLGHWLLGERRRASILASTIGILWLTGALLGGISVFDIRNHFWWFLAQACAAPSIPANFVHQTLRGGGDPPLPMPYAATPPRYEPAFGKIEEQGVLYTALAGLLNLLAVLDVAVRDPSRRRADAEPQPNAPAGGVA